ncbi:hypothetical protein KAR91_86795 [Candidatus Pacearchaeota archaeon]|nr:hypothetical protein [Candidatus Pacearchaeota archaeon]
MKLIIYYNVGDGGDGSAYPNFYESEELASWDEEEHEPRWGEPSAGKMVFESDSPITHNIDIETKEAYLIDKYLDGYSPDERLKQKFIEKFFPDGLPTFSVTTEPVKTTDEYLYNNVFVDGKKVAKEFKSVEESGKVFEDFLNAFGK